LWLIEVDSELMKIVRRLQRLAFAPLGLRKEFTQRLTKIETG
jgi:hypothetical protein